MTQYTEDEVQEFWTYFKRQGAADKGTRLNGLLGLISLEAEWGKAKCVAIANELINRSIRNKVMDDHGRLS